MSSNTNSLTVAIKHVDLTKKSTGNYWGDYDNAHQEMQLESDAVTISLRMPKKIAVGKHDLSHSDFLGSQITSSMIPGVNIGKLHEGLLTIEALDFTPGAQIFKGNLTLAVISTLYPGKLVIECPQFEFKNYNG